MLKTSFCFSVFQQSFRKSEKLKAKKNNFPMSVLNKQVSYFQSKNATTKCVEINLLTLLRSDKHKELIQTLRSSEKEIQKQLKDNLPCYTVAGKFNRRCDEGIIQLSGLAAVDLDSAEGADIPYLLNELKKIDCIAYAGLSCRGSRLFCIVPFLYPEKYLKHYERLIQSFTDMGLPMGDNCHKTISQPRFISWNDDSTQFFNHEAKAYSLLSPEKIFHPVKRNVNSSVAGSPVNPFEWCNEQINKSHSFIKDNRHSYIIALARYCNIKGISEQDTLNGCHKYELPDFSEDEILKIVRHVFTKHADSHNKLPFKPGPVTENPKPVPDNKPELRQTKKAITGSFLGTDGKFYIPNPVQPNQVAVYESPDAYNQRSHLPTYIDKKKADPMFQKSLQIDPETLLIISE